MSCVSPFALFAFFVVSPFHLFKKTRLWTISWIKVRSP